MQFSAPQIVSFTHRSLQVQQLVTQLGEHLATLPITEVERAALQFQLRTLHDSQVEETTTWQRLAYTAAHHTMAMIRQPGGYTPSALVIGIIAATIIGHTEIVDRPLADVMATQKLREECSCPLPETKLDMKEILVLHEQWPQLQIQRQ